MARRKDPHSRPPFSPKTILVIIAVFTVVVVAYAVRQPVRGLFVPEDRADVTVLHAAVDSACAAVRPARSTTSTIDLGGRDVRCDLLELPRDASVFRANREITLAVEKAGGRISYGLDSSDEKRRWRTITLGISDGDSLVREVRLKKRIRR
jgi:hypothetical protein